MKPSQTGPVSPSSIPMVRETRPMDCLRFLPCTSSYLPCRMRRVRRTRRVSELGEPPRRLARPFPPQHPSLSRAMHIAFLASLRWSQTFLLIRRELGFSRRLRRFGGGRRRDSGRRRGAVSMGRYLFRASFFNGCLLENFFFWVGRWTAKRLENGANRIDRFVLLVTPD